LAYQNVRGLNMKLPKLYADSFAFSEDILAFTETWLKPEISDSEVLSKNFNTYRTDRSPLRGWGAGCRYLYFIIGENILS